MTKIFLYNVVNTMRAMIGRCLWTIKVQTHGWRHGKLVFLCFPQHNARFWKCLRDYFGLSKWRHWNVFSRSCLEIKQKQRNRDKKSSWWLEIALTGRREILTIVAIVCHRYERHAVLKMVSRLSCVEQVKALKNFRRNCRQVTKDKEEVGTKGSACALQNAYLKWHKSSNGARQTLSCFLFCLLYKTNGFLVARGMRALWRLEIFNLTMLMSDIFYCPSVSALTGFDCYNLPQISLPRLRSPTLTIISIF